MNKKMLNNLIDKVIGKEGPLRVPSYWMRKVLKSIGDSINDVEKSLGRLKIKLEKYVDTKVDAKADKMPIESYTSWHGLRPNVYTTYTIGFTGSETIKLANIADYSIYNEYIIEIKCTSTPSNIDFSNMYGTKLDINWANDNVPVFEAGYTYIISIVNNFGVFAQFTNP